MNSTKNRGLKLPRTIEKFIQLEASSGIVLALAAILALLFANSPLAESYFSFIHVKVGSLSLQHWINDGLMVIFFFVVGLEIKKEIIAGELSTLKKAAFPIAGALGGMILPAIIYAYFNPSSPALNGWGIPMATDIAFAVGILTLFGKRVPLSLKIFLLALAIVDDLGAVLVIAFFYTLKINFIALGLAALAFVVVFGLQKMKVKSYLAYVVIGLIAWAGILLSGVHATIAGVVLGLMTPLQFPKARDRQETYSPLDELVHFLHPWISFLVMPIFAFANAGISILGIDPAEIIKNPVHQGILLGLVVGKPVGILFFTGLTVILRLGALPLGVRWGQVLAVACLAGMGFTMSLFISSLALPPDFEIYSKTGILLGSIIAAAVGAIALTLTLKPSGQTN